MGDSGWRMGDTTADGRSDRTLNPLFFIRCGIIFPHPPEYQEGGRMGELIYPQLSYDIRGACYEVHNALRHFDLSEAGWETALAVALHGRGISAHRQVELALHYKKWRVGRFFVDVIAERGDKVLLELKRVPLEPIHRAKVIAYLRMTGIQLGMLITFAGERVVIERIVNRVSDHSAAAVEVRPPVWLMALDYGRVEELWQVFCEVRSELGPGLMHMHYRRACQVEMRLRRMPFEKINEVVVQFHGQPIESRRAPLLVFDDRLMVVPLAVLRITPDIEDRNRHYLKYLGLKQGLIANFRTNAMESVMIEA
jgi:GxxExxY protein